MATLTSKLIVSLVDRTGAGARAVTRNMRTMKGAAAGLTPVLAQSTQAVRQHSRTMRAFRTVGGHGVPGLGTMMGAGGLYALGSDAYSFDKDLRYLGATAELSTDRMNQFADAIARVAEIYPKTRSELLRSAVEGVTAGLDVDTIEALLPAVTKISMAVREDMGRVTGDLTDIVMGAGMKFRGESAETQVESFMEVARMMIAGTTMFNQKWEGFVSGLRHAAPVASALGIELTKTTTALGFLADAGFKGERGGTALRTILISLINPTKKAARTMRALRLDMNEFLNMDDSKVGAWELFDKDGKLIGGLKSSLAASGIQVLKRDIPALRKLLRDPKLQRDVTAFNEAVKGFLVRKGYVDGQDLESVQLVQDAVTQHVMSASKNFDIVGLLKQLQEANPSQLAQLVGKRRLPMLIALINNVDKLNDAEKRLAKTMLGIVDRRAQKQMVGYAASVDKLRSSFDAFLYKIYESGFFDTISELFVGKNFNPETGENLGGLAKFVETLGQSNPELLKFGFLAGAAMVALAPIGFILTGVVSTFTLFFGVIKGVVRGLRSLVGLLGRLKGAAKTVQAVKPLFSLGAGAVGGAAAASASAKMLSGMGKSGQMIAGMSKAGAAARAGGAGKTGSVLGKLAKGGAKFAGRLFWPLTIGLAAWDAWDGYQKTGTLSGAALNALTFGLYAGDAKAEEVPQVPPGASVPTVGGAASPVNTAELQRIRSQAQTITATVQDSMSQVRAIVAGVNLEAEGERIMHSLAAGIRRGGAAVRAATNEAASAGIRNAVRGAYSDGGR